MLHPPTLMKTPSGLLASAGLNAEYLNSSAFLSRTWQHGETQLRLWPSACFPLSSPFNRDPLDPQMDCPGQTSKFLPRPLTLTLS